ncbi:hypothetical protein KSP40_PGU015607 [Platanthera guangdongensis]|uniref:Uncharacterized protein n=1 Tax=Platanthera guangdongensis TaxID=2320717 RepID=A0ABR2LIS9_9ASPA
MTYPALRSCAQNSRKPPLPPVQPPHTVSTLLLGKYGQSYKEGGARGGGRNGGSSNGRAIPMIGGASMVPRTSGGASPKLKHNAAHSGRSVSTAALLIIAGFWLQSLLLHFPEYTGRCEGIRFDTMERRNTRRTQGPAFEGCVDPDPSKSLINAPRQEETIVAPENALARRVV